MTKKHFIAMAIEFGALYRDADSAWKEDNATVSDSRREIDAIDECVRAFCRVAASTNPRFDRDHFEQYVSEVRYRARDLTGKKVKSVSLA